jgi:hypothetical protein
MKKLVTVLVVFLLTFAAGPGFAAQQTAKQTLTITINSPLTITTASVPNAVLTQAYTATIAAANGTAPYTFSLSSGALPAGLTLAASTGIISGTPTASGSFSFTVKVADSGAIQQSVTASFTMIVSTVLTITTTTLPAGTVGVAYAQTIAISGGTTPYTCAVSTGTLPAGLTLSQPTAAAPNSCTISGTPTAAGSTQITITVTDSGTVAARLTAQSTAIAPE